MGAMQDFAELHLKPETLAKYGLPVRLPVPFAQASQYNYLIATNDYDFDTPRSWYYFVQTCDYINANTTQLNIQLDVWQSFQHDIQLGNAYVERGHVGVANENACIYLIKCYNDSEIFFKIGITTREVSRRFAGFTSMPYNYELLHKYHSDGESIWNLETQLHRHYKDVKYVPLISFGGMHECFSHIDLQEYVSVLLAKINSN